MANATSDNQDSDALLKVLAAHYRALVSARSDETVLRQYALLLRALKSNPFQFLDERGNAKAPSAGSRTLPTINEAVLHNASLDELEKIVTDDGTARKDLEFIAIQRFSVPRGSMRRFSDKQMLVNKLRTLIGNERTHETIGAVARDQEKRP